MYTADEHDVEVLGAAAGLLWLAATLVLGLAAVTSMSVSSWLIVPFGLWTLLAAGLGFWLPGASGASPHQAATVIGLASCASAGALAILTPGSELLWAVVLCCGLATLYSIVVTRRVRPRP